MKIKKICLIFVAFLVFFISFTLMGCEENQSIQIEKSDKEFKIGSFYTPFNGESGAAPYGLQPTDNTVENWQAMKDAGFTFALPIYDTNNSYVLKSLENAEKVGIKIYVMDYENPSITNIIAKCDNVSYDLVKAELERNTEALVAKYTEYTKYESFGGLHATDEPSVERYDGIAACQDWWYEHFPEYEFFTNLFPSYASENQLYGLQEGYTYRDYVNEFCEKVNPSVISYDHYTLMANGLRGYIRPQWLSDLEAYATASKKYNVPFQIYILTTQHWGYYAPEYYRDVAWQAYSAMCFGIKGLQTFTYWGYLKPYNDTNNLGTGLVDALGNKMPVYYACQELFKEIHSFDEYYLNFDWVGTMPIGTSGSGTFALMTDPLEKVSGIKMADATEDALIGEFTDKKGNTAYMVTNYSLPYDNKSNTVSLEFENATKLLICKKGKLVEMELKNHKIDITLGSGEGYFIIPIQN